MQGKFNIKELSDHITKWIDKRNLSISIMIGLATALWIIANLYFNDLTAVGTRVLKQTGKELGTLALVFAVAAFSYYVLREAYVYGRKKSAFVKQEQSFFSFSLLILRRLHIWFGVLTVAFIIDHGYLMWIVQKSGTFTIRMQTGLIVATFFCALAFFGILIRIYPAVKKFRVTHRIFAFLIFIGCLVHIAVQR